MRPLLILLLVFSFFSCNKDESDLLHEKYSKEEILNAVVGTWKFSRLGYDAEFKKIKDIKARECALNGSTILKNDCTIIAEKECVEDIDEGMDLGSFIIQFGGMSSGDEDTHIITNRGGFNLIPGKRWYGGWLTLHRFTDSTLVFSDVKWESEDGPQYDEYKLFSELKRVK